MATADTTALERALASLDGPQLASLLREHIGPLVAAEPELRAVVDAAVQRLSRGVRESGVYPALRRR